MFKVRFHLAKGKNFQKWQVRHGRTVAYYDPSQVQLVLKGCTLHNQPATAKKICDGQEKTVCAWVACDSVEVIHNFITLADVPVCNLIHYNPKKTPFWRDGNDNNIDKSTHQEIHSLGRQLFKV